MNLSPYKLEKADYQDYPWAVLDRNNDETALIRRKEEAEMICEALNSGEKMQRILDAVFQYGGIDVANEVNQVLQNYEK